MVLPCIGSQHQTTVRPARCTASMSLGKPSVILSDPKRQMSVMRPASSPGLSLSSSFIRSSVVRPGPHFMPIGFLMPLKYSVWAPSGWRVRSPIQSMWPEVAYQSLVIESRRVSASS
jgi:hypothetical protein